MCVFKYHAFIFYMRPPRWRYETVISLLGVKNELFFCYKFACHRLGNFFSHESKAQKSTLYTVPAKSLGRSHTNSMKKAINSFKSVYFWLIWERTSRIWQAGHNRQNRTARTGLPQIGFLNLIWLRVLARGSQDPPQGRRVILNTLSWFLTVLRCTLALHSSTAALLSSFLRFFLTCFFLLHWLRKCKRFTFTWTAAKQKVFVLEHWNFIPNSSIQSFFSETLFQKSTYYRKKVI